ncbi:hypothetical protein [Endozoicomonas sp. GU-1]|uniref:hypothetical protein n=1 Tax=Endozoicomonas sp. GU-1 TaxID=3009078 RepID=UPI0022B5D8C9|nr:hypothetical protein [Endozoicomonas sp. GU-1]WBA86495.1 hypothetical protein O3276_00090 [Endozoicomonas sp. GU-1]
MIQSQHLITHTHTLEPAFSEHLTGDRKKRIKRTSTTEIPVKPLKTGGYREIEKRINNEYWGNTLANQKIGKSEYLKSKKVNKNNDVRFHVRSYSLLKRISVSQSYQGLWGRFASRFAIFAFSDQPYPFL